MLLVRSRRVRLWRRAKAAPLKLPWLWSVGRVQCGDLVRVRGRSFSEGFCELGSDKAVRRGRRSRPGTGGHGTEMGTFQYG